MSNDDKRKKEPRLRKKEVLMIGCTDSHLWCHSWINGFSWLANSVCSFIASTDCLRFQFQRANSYRWVFTHTSTAALQLLLTNWLFNKTTSRWPVDLWCSKEGIVLLWVSCMVHFITFTFLGPSALICSL